jgi:hypothetical protein
MEENKLVGGSFRGTTKAFLADLLLAIDQLPRPDPTGFGLVATADVGFFVDPTSCLKPTKK